MSVCVWSLRTLRPGKAPYSIRRKSHSLSQEHLKIGVREKGAEAEDYRQMSSQEDYIIFSLIKSMHVVPIMKKPSVRCTGGSEEVEIRCKCIFLLAKQVLFTNWTRCKWNV